MPVFRLDNISIQQVETAFTQILLPLDVIAIILLAFVFTVSKCYRVYDEFPGTLFLWLLPLDFFYGLLVGPLRWAKGSLLFETLGDVQVMSDAACKFAAFVDTFFQMGSLYLNTMIIATVFYMVFHTSSLHGDTAVKARNYAAIGFFVFSLPLAIASLTVTPYRGVGFCMCDGLVLVIKQTIWYTAILCQVSMVIPTQYRIYQSSQVSMKSLSKGTYLRFCGIIFTQIIGLVPIMLIEAYGLTRQKVPRGLIYFMAVGFPLGHLLDAALMSIKALPALLPALESLFAGWESSKGKKSSKDQKSSKGSNKGSKGSKAGSKGSKTGATGSKTGTKTGTTTGSKAGTKASKTGTKDSSSKKSTKKEDKKSKKKHKKSKNSKPSKHSEPTSMMSAIPVKSFAEAGVPTVTGAMTDKQKDNPRRDPEEGVPNTALTVDRVIEVDQSVLDPGAISDQEGRISVLNPRSYNSQPSGHHARSYNSQTLSGPKQLAPLLMEEGPASALGNDRSLHPLAEDSSALSDPDSNPIQNRRREESRSTALSASPKAGHHLSSRVRRALPTVRERQITKPVKKAGPAPTHANEVPMVRLRRYHNTRGRFLFKIVCTLMLPVIVIVGFCGYEIQNEANQVTQNNLLLNDLNLVPVISSYAHEIDVEAYAANMVINAGGNHYQLIFQVELTDTNVAQDAFLAQAKTYQGRLRTPTFETLLDTTELNNERNKILNLTINNVADVKQYAIVGDNLFQSMGEMEVATRTAGIASHLYAFIAAVEYKAQIGNERVVVMDFMASYDTPSWNASYLNFMSILAAEAAAQSLFKSWASPYAMGLYQAALNTPASVEIAKLHTALLSQDFSLFNQTSATDYYNNLSALRITLNSLQLDIAAEVVAIAEQTMTSLFAGVMGYLWTLVLSLWAVIVMMYISASTLRMFGTDIAFLRRHDGPVKTGSDELGEVSLFRTISKRLQLPFEWQILVSLIVPSACLVVIILYSITTNASASVDAATIRNHVEVCTALTYVLNSLGQESATVILYVQHGLQSDLLAYQAQQAVVDAYTNTLVEVAKENFGGTDLDPLYQRLVQNQAALEAQRAISITLNSTAIQSFYNDLKNSLLGLLYTLASITDSDSVEHMMLILLSVSNFKRSSGRVSSDGVNIIQRQGFLDETEYGTLVTNLATGQDWLNMATRFSTSAELPVVNSFPDSASGAARPTWESVLTSWNDTAIAQLTAPEWFYLRSKGDIVIRTIRDTLSQNLVSYAQAQVDSWTTLMNAHIAVMLVGGTLSFFMVLRSVFKVRGFTRLMLQYLEKEEKRLDEVEMTQKRMTAQESDATSGTDTESEGTSQRFVHKKHSSRRNSTGTIRGPEMTQISNLLLADFRLDTSPEGHQSHHQAVLNFFSWISTTEGLVTCNRMLFSRSQPGEGVQSLEFWTELGALQTLAGQARGEANALKRAELGEEMYEKAEKIYLTFVKDKLLEREMPQAAAMQNNLAAPRLSPRGVRAKSKSVIGNSNNNAHGRESSDGSVGSPWRHRMNTSLHESSVSNRSNRAHENRVEQETVAQSRNIPSPSQKRRFSLTDVLDDPTRLALFHKYCVAIRSTEVYEFLVAVRKFKRRCASLSAEDITAPKKGVPMPEDIIQEAEDIYSKFIDKNAPVRVNISSSSYQELTTIFSEDFAPVVTQALQLEGVFDVAYNEVRRLMVHNILGNVLSEGLSKGPKL